MLGSAEAVAMLIVPLSFCPCPAVPNFVLESPFKPVCTHSLHGPSVVEFFFSGICVRISWHRYAEQVLDSWTCLLVCSYSSHA